MNSRRYNIFQINSFLYDTKTFHLSVANNGNPASCPLDIHLYLDQKLMFGIASDNPIYTMMRSNPHICISAYREDGTWFRYTGKAVFEEDLHYAHVIYKRCPTLTRHYNDMTQRELMMFHLEDSTAYIIDSYQHSYHVDI